MNPDHVAGAPSPVRSLQPLHAMLATTARSRWVPPLAAALLSAGCYDADALRAKRTEVHEVVHTEEIDLGEFQITLPHIPGNPHDSIVEFHAFGHVESGDRAAIDRALAVRGAELRHRMLLSIRSLASVDFDEPHLTALRGAIAEVLNAALEKPLVKKVGFYQFSFTTI